MTQEEAFKILKTGDNVFLTGKAGSGKTYLLNQYIDYLKQNNVAVGVTASTGIAATHMEGLTIHSWAGIGIKDSMTDDEIRLLLFKDRLQDRFARTKVLIIDEISMLHSYRLDLVDRVAKMFRASPQSFGGLQVILCGDFFQLPPVSRNANPADFFAFKAQSWEDSDLRVCYLETQYRQTDKTYSSLLNDIRDNKVNEETIETLRPRYQAEMKDPAITKLYTHNADVDAINNLKLSQLRGEAKHFLMQSSGEPKLVDSLKQNCLAPEDLVLKKGAVVMFLKNNFERGYVNGTLGTILEFEAGGYPVVKTRNGEQIEAVPESWRIEDEHEILAEIDQIPLRLAWAITVHKSQGMSLDAAEVDLSKSFEPGMGYVALSRIRTLAGLRLMGLNETALKVNQEVLAIDQEFLSRSQKEAIALKKTSSEELKHSHNLFLNKSSVTQPPKSFDIKDLKKKGKKKTSPVASWLNKIGL
ncbi:MAG: PIF1 family DEAD/DEAH box helicase [candidate division WWE3 bacterium]|nr:PIF1 family DEAD/DEAH box helicase [candidate division WWE3 bacterium]